MTRPQAFVRFVLCMAAAWAFMYLVPMKWFVMTYIPFSFFLLMGTVGFGVLGLGWPFAVPGGSWKPGTSRVLTGALMTAAWLGTAFVLTWFVSNVYPKMPMTHWFGIGVFMVTLWYTFDGVVPHPFKKPWLNWLFGNVFIMAAALVLWRVFVNLKGTPAAGAPFDPKGIFPGDYWFGLCVWIIVWVQVWGFPMCFQGWPFYKLPKGVFQVVLTAVCVALGYGFWQGGLSLGIPPTFWFGGVAASMIGWSLMHSVAFEMYPFAVNVQPKRGVQNFILEQIVLAAAWIGITRLILQPMVPKVQATGLPIDINLLNAFYTLHVTAIVLLVHQFFFMRVPLSIPGPPLAPDQAAPQEAEAPLAAPAEAAAEVVGGGR